VSFLDRWLGKPGAATDRRGQYTCPLCSETIPASEILAHAALDDQRFRDGRMIARIRQDHPEWIEADGACPKCIEFYRKAISAERPKIRVN
jgi:hypothetical protein